MPVSRRGRNSYEKKRTDAGHLPLHSLLRTRRPHLLPAAPCGAGLAAFAAADRGGRALLLPPLTVPRYALPLQYERSIHEDRFSTFTAAACTDFASDLQGRFPEKELTVQPQKGSPRPTENAGCGDPLPISECLSGTRVGKYTPARVRMPSPVAYQNASSGTQIGLLPTACASDCFLRHAHQTVASGMRNSTSVPAGAL